MNEPNHECRICGKRYYACNDCDRLKSWRSVCCAPEHYQVYQVLVMYAQGIVDAPTAAEMLDELGYTMDHIDGVTPQKQEEILAILIKAEEAELCSTDDKNNE